MAPLKGEGVGWERLPHLFLANYGCRLSRGYAPCLRQPTMQEWKKLPGFNPAECHSLAKNRMIASQAGIQGAAAPWRGVGRLNIFPLFQGWGGEEEDFLNRPA